MSYEQTKEYLFMIMDMEKNIYIQEKTIEDLTNQANSLGFKKNFDYPRKEKAYANFSDFFYFFALIIGIIAGIVTFIREKTNSSDNGVILGFLDNVAFIIKSLFFAVIIGAIGGLVISGIICIIIIIVRGIKYKSEYNKKMNERNQNVILDNQRAQDELIQKEYINQQISILKEQYDKSMNTLNSFYSYNIIDEKYRHNLAAICSFCQYFRSGKTYSLSFNPKTGDPGAYNIYDNEYLQGLIITKLDIVITKLDEISYNQKELVSAIYQANDKIDSLSKSVITSSKRIENSINRQSAIEAYNYERIRKEIEYGNTMNMIYNLH